MGGRQRGAVAGPSRGLSPEPIARERQWLRLWSVARYDLRLSDRQFYALTPRQLDALLKRRERETAEREFLFGQLASCVVNFGFCQPKEPAKPSDFMPSQRHARPRAARKRRSAAAGRQQIADGLREVMRAVMGQPGAPRNTL